MGVIATKSGITREFTCAQYDAMDAGGGWTVESRNCEADNLKAVRSPFAASDAGDAIFAYTSRRFIRFQVASPGAGQAISGDLLTQSFVIKSSGSARTISIGTTPGGTEIIDNEPIRAGEAWVWTFIAYYEDPTFYFTPSATIDGYIVFDLLSQ